LNRGKFKRKKGKGKRKYRGDKSLFEGDIPATAPPRAEGRRPPRKKRKKKGSREKRKMGIKRVPLSPAIKPENA